MGGSPTLQTRYVTPSASTQYINPQTGYDGLNQCVVYGDSNLVSGNIKSRVSIFGVNRNYTTNFYSINVDYDLENAYNFNYSNLGFSPTCVVILTREDWDDDKIHQDIDNRRVLTCFLFKNAEEGQVCRFNYLHYTSRVGLQVNWTFDSNVTVTWTNNSVALTQDRYIFSPSQVYIF